MTIRDDSAPYDPKLRVIWGAMDVADQLAFRAGDTEARQRISDACEALWALAVERAKERADGTRQR